MTIFQGMHVERSAIISPCGLFRYVLTRRWSITGALLVFVMLNPSTADGHVDDPTVRKCMGFAHRLGYGGIVILNLFAYRARDPADLRKAGYPVGPDNDFYIGNVLQGRSGPVVCAWGANARRQQGRVTSVMNLLHRMGADTRALRVLPDLTPSHPLMLPYSCQLELYA